MRIGCGVCSHAGSHGGRISLGPAKPLRFVSVDIADQGLGSESSEPLNLMAIAIRAIHIEVMGPIELSITHGEGVSDGRLGAAP
jgi:hypothetical protein